MAEEEEREGGDKEQGAGLFDAIVASEVVEHLADRETFALCCSCMLKVCSSSVCVCVISSSCYVTADISASEPFVSVCSSERMLMYIW